MSTQTDLDRASKIVEHIETNDPWDCPGDPHNSGRMARIIGAGLCEARERAIAEAAGRLREQGMEELARDILRRPWGFP